MLTMQQKTILEGTTAVYTCILQDSDGNPVPKYSLTSLTITLHDVATGNVLNNRSDQSILDVNNATMHATSGLLTWTMQPEDNQIINSQIEGGLEVHCAEITWVWGNPANTGKHQVLFYVKALDAVGTTTSTTTTTTTTADPSQGIPDIANLLAAPEYTRTDEGSVKERSVDELIKADAYLKGTASGNAVPWGLRIAKSKPSGTIMD